MERSYIKDSRDIQGICQLSVLEILHILGGMDGDSTHTVELLDVIHDNTPPEDFTECGHPTAGALADVMQFAAAEGDNLLCCSINARSTETGTHWIIGCYCPTAFYDRYISRERPTAGRPGNVILYKWTHDYTMTNRDGLRYNMGHWSIYPLKGEKQH